MVSIEQTREKLHIPGNVKTRTELFPGYGMAEVGKTLMTALVITVTAFLIYLYNRNLTFMIISLIVSVAFGITVHRKDDNNLSVADQITFMVRFARARKILPYRYEKE